MNTLTLPDVHFVTAGAYPAGSCVAVVGGTAPALGVGFSFDELDILGTLSIAVSGTILGTGGVGGGHSTVGGHGDEVKSTVDTA